jgi:hypothetical protein
MYDLGGFYLTVFFTYVLIIVLINIHYLYNIQYVIQNTYYSNTM